MFYAPLLLPGVLFSTGGEKTFKELFLTSSPGDGTKDSMAIASLMGFQVRFFHLLCLVLAAPSRPQQGLILLLSSQGWQWGLQFPPIV